MPEAGLLFRDFFVSLPSECVWKHFKIPFASKVCLGMVGGGLGKRNAPLNRSSGQFKTEFYQF